MDVEASGAAENQPDPWRPRTPSAGPGPPLLAHLCRIGCAPVLGPGPPPGARGRQLSRPVSGRAASGVLDGLRVPIVQAPLSGGPSTPELTIAAGRAGAFGFLAGGYRGPEALREDIGRVRAATAQPFGVNLFVPGSRSADAAAIDAYAERVRGEPAWSDDQWRAKLDLVLAERPAVVSFTFGCPDRAVFDALHAAGVEAWVTVTEASEAEQAAEVGADALVVQGVEAG